MASPDTEPCLELSVVVPCYLDAHVIRETCTRLLECLVDIGMPFEIVLVNDGSPDGTWQQIRTLCRENPGKVVGVDLWRNFGQHQAVCAGFKVARGRFIVTIDSDLQEDPATIPALLEKLEEGFDIATGVRKQRAEGPARSWPSMIVSGFLRRVTGTGLRDFGCMFRAYRRDIARLIEQYPTRSKLITAYSAWLGARIAEVPIEHRRRVDDAVSRYSLRALVEMAADLLTSYTQLPIRLITGCGAAFFLLGCAMASVLLGYRVLYGSGPSGMVLLLALQFIFAGAQLGCLGIVGLYVGRIYSQVDGKPFVLVREVVSDDAGRSS